MGERLALRWLKATLGRIWEPRTLVLGLVLAVIIGGGAIIRFHFAAFLDPFEDGYQNWWISANLVSTGQYWDRHSMMTQGNWLPLYHFFAAGVLKLAGLRSINALKAANVVLSSLTAVTIFLASRKRGPIIALAATGFFSFNLIDIVVSGWATAETLTSFLVLVGYAMLFQATRPRVGRIWIAAAALALAVMTRYEAWLIVCLMLIYIVLVDSGQQRRRMLVALLPAIGLMAAYFAYSAQWGFLPAIVVRQTSTDIQYQLSVGSQPTPMTLLSRWWTGYISFFPLVLLVGGVYAVWSLKKEFGAWIVLSLWVFIVGYTVLRFGNPSFRYVMIAVPFLSIFGAVGLVEGLKGAKRLRRRVLLRSPQKTTAVVTLGFVLMGATLFPSTAALWGLGFSASAAMEPLKRAGMYVSTLPLPEGKMLISESPIAAYFSGYAPDRILGSRWIPDNRSQALLFLKTNAAYIVYMGVPYYRLRSLFPELQNGSSTPDFTLLFDAGGVQAGTHAVFVYGVVP
ncbi:MAG: hypothetical protein AUH07_06120 [Gemmatimonadetes bacterium 13_2_20CM_70_9]|nr:MAG: hypothetical protein AUH07_06120 [Gemmatimonadetes bacterium 13_2_20CM_70_9]